MPTNFKGTTSHTAIISGMTDSSEAAAWWQAGPAHAEQIADVAEGGGSSAEGGEDINEATGLTPAEQAEFDRMANEPAPTGDSEDVVDDGDGEGDGDPEPEAAPPSGKEKTPAELEAEAQTRQKTAPKTINFNRHQRELKKAADRAAALEVQLQEERTKQIKVNERLAIINEALAQQQAAAQAAQQQQQVDPNAPPENPFEEPDVDPTEDYAESVKQLQRRQRYQLDQQQHVQQTFQETTADTQLRETFTRDMQSAAAADPNVMPAYNFLKDQRLRQIILANTFKDPSVPEEAAMITQAEVNAAVQAFNQEEKWLVSQAIKQNRSPAATIMRQASIYGYQPQQAAPAAAPAARAPAAPAARNGTGRAIAAPAAAPSAAQQLADLAAARDAGRSLSDAGGAPPSGLSVNQLIDMGDEEFAELVDSLPPHKLAELMGRE